MNQKEEKHMNQKVIVCKPKWSAWDMITLIKIILEVSLTLFQQMVIASQELKAGTEVKMHAE